jgi:hypothetical protein
VWSCLPVLTRVFCTPDAAAFQHGSYPFTGGVLGLCPSHVSKYIAPMTTSERANESTLWVCVCDGVWDAYTSPFFELPPPGMV